MPYPFNNSDPTSGEIPSLGDLIGQGPRLTAEFAPALSSDAPGAGVEGSNQFSVEQFKAKFLEVGLVTPSSFLVKFTAPPSIFDKPEDAKMYEDVPFLCGATKLPGMRVATTSLRRYNYGNIIKMPYDALFDDIELTFYVDASQAKSLDVFHKWIRSMIDVGKDFEGGKRGKTNFVSYRNEYICPELKIFIVSQLAGLENPESMPEDTNSNGDSQAEGAGTPNPPATPSTGNYAIVECTLYDVFPIQIGDIGLDWGEADNFARVNVTFSYRVHEFKFGRFNKRSLGFKTGYSYSPISSTLTGVDPDAAQQADFLTSLTQFLGRVADTKRKVQQFQTNWRTFQNAKGGLGKLTALGNLAGPGSALNTTANQLNQIVSLTNFITGNGTAKARSGTKKVINTLP